MPVAIVLPYTTIADVVFEAKLKGHLNLTFTDDDVANIINQTISIVNQFTDKTIADPWTAVGDPDTFPMVVAATRIGAAGYLLQMYANKQEDGQKKIDLMFSTLKNFIYGEEGGDKGDIFFGAGSFELPQFEEIVNEDINADTYIGNPT